MSFTCSMKWFSLFVLFIVWSGQRNIILLNASEPELLEIVKKHEDNWGNIETIQLFFTSHYKSTVVSKPLPNGYWESGNGKMRSIVAALDSFSTDKSGKPIATEMCVDFFCDSKDTYTFTIPRDKYPLTEIKLCDYIDLKSIGGNAVIFSGRVDMRSRYLLPRYFSVHTEDAPLSLSELVDRYSAEIVSAVKSKSGDDIIEIGIECRSDTHEHLSPWLGKIHINKSKGCNIEGYRFSAVTKSKPQVELITECFIKKHVKTKEGNWIPSEWEVIKHNGKLTEGIKTSFVINDCKINDSSKSRLDDFRFPTNFVVGEYRPGQTGMITHIWGADNKPAHSFDTGKKYVDYYSQMCMTGEMVPHERKYFALRITLMVLGLIMIAFALYRLYAKDR